MKNKLKKQNKNLQNLINPEHHPGMAQFLHKILNKKKEHIREMEKINFKKSKKKKLKNKKK